VTVSSKAERFGVLHREADAVLSGESDPVLWMATLSCLVYHAFDFLWVGFYRARGSELVIGPYQGTLGCLRIPFEKGVCGACASERKTIIVPDVHKFAGHIACDSRSRSEIVVPVFDRAGNLQAVFDLDSDRTGTFDEVDRRCLEQLVEPMKGLNWGRES
jgi:GAF domain-containing protein